MRRITVFILLPLLTFSIFSFLGFVPETKAIETPQTTWTNTFGGITDDYGAFMYQTSDGGYAIVGATTSFGAGGADVWLVKTDQNGNHVWNQTYGGTNNEQAYSVVQTTDSGYALTGAISSFGAGGADVWLVKTDQNGNHVWNQTYGGTNNEQAYSVVQTTDSGYALTGAISSFGAGGADVWLVKTDQNGNHVWNQTYGGTINDYGYSGIQTNDGGYAITGYTKSFGAGGADVWLIKVEPEIPIPTPTPSSSPSPTPTSTPTPSPTTSPDSEPEEQPLGLYAIGLIGIFAVIGLILLRRKTKHHKT